MPTRPYLLLEAKRYLIGVALLLGVVILWTVSNFITNSLETGDDAWNKPFLITYFNTASFTAYLIPSLVRYWASKGDKEEVKHEGGYEPISQQETGPRRRSLSPSSSPRRPPASIDLAHVPLEEAEPLAPSILSVKETARVAAWWVIIWFGGNWAVNASLAWTSVASVTILSSTSGFFTLALGRMVGVESFTRLKLFAVIASFLGVVFVTRSDSSLAVSTDLPSHPLLGDFAALLSAVFYAIYVILLKAKVVDEDRADMQLMLGLAGLFSTTAFLPLVPILHFTGLERFELPHTRTAWTIVAVNMAITLSSDYMYMLAMLKTSPMLVTVGLSLTIPLALVASPFIPSSNAQTITLMSLAGGGMVVVAFIFLGYQGWKESVAPVPLEDLSREGETV